MLNKTVKIFIVFFISLVAIICTQKKEINSYFGQKPPGMEPILFASGIVSTYNHEHSRIEFSKDGKELYWTVMPIDTNTLTHTGRPFNVKAQKIWFTNLIEQDWSSPSTLPFNLQKICSPTLSVNGDKLYFKALDSNSTEKDDLLREVFWETIRIGDVWKTPTINTTMPLYKNGRASMSFCFSDNQNIYFDLFVGDKENPKWAIYFSEYTEAGYLNPKELSEEINTGDVNWTPWVSPDETYLIFSSHREGNNGSGDLYISFRKQNGQWSESLNMGRQINTEYQERFPSVSPDGEYLFFSRTTDTITYSDIYWVDAIIIEQLKSQRQ